MTKSELIQRVADVSTMPTAKAELVINTLFDSMTDALIKGDRIEVRGFGTFEVRSYKGYEGRNPKSGETVSVAPKRLPFFKTGKELHERLNKENSGPSSSDPP